MGVEVRFYPYGVSRGRELPVSVEMRKATVSY